MGFFDEETQRHIKQRIADEGLTDNNEKVVYMRACAVGKLENKCVEAFVANEEEILNGTFEGSLIDHIEETQRQAYKHCSTLSYQRIYHSKPVLDVELAGYKIMQTLMETMIEAAVNPERFYSQQLLRRFSSQYDIQSPDLETRIMAVIDYISGMTDVYALEIYQKINGISLPIIWYIVKYLLYGHTLFYLSLSFFSRSFSKIRRNKVFDRTSLRLLRWGMLKVIGEWFLSHFL